MADKEVVLITKVSELSPKLRGQLENSVAKVSKNIADLCTATNLSGSSINISGLKADNCNLEISGIKQTIDSTLNSECINVNGAEVFKDIIVKFREEMINEMEKNKDTLEIIEKIDQIISNDNYVENINTCAITSIQNQSFNFINNKVICPEIVVTDIFGRKVTYPGTIKITDIEQTIVSSVLNNCHIINNDVLSELHKYDQIVNKEFYENKKKEFQNKPSLLSMKEIEDYMYNVPTENNPAELRVLDIVGLSFLGAFFLGLIIGLTILLVNYYRKKK